MRSVRHRGSAHRACVPGRRRSLATRSRRCARPPSRSHRLSVAKNSCSPRFSCNVTDAPLSSFASSALTCSALFASVVWPRLTIARITSPGCTLPRTGPAMSSTSTPLLTVELLLLLVGEIGQHEAHPVGLGLLLRRRTALLRRRATGASSFISATVTAMSFCAPLRQTVSVTLVPGLIIVMIRGSSVDVRTSRPSTLMMMSPASTPAFSAGPPFSTELTSAPVGFGKPERLGGLLGSPR